MPALTYTDWLAIERRRNRALETAIDAIGEMMLTGPEPSADELSALRDLLFDVDNDNYALSVARSRMTDATNSPERRLIDATKAV